MSGISTPSTASTPAPRPAPSAATLQRLRAQWGAQLQSHHTLALLELGDATCALIISEGQPEHTVPVVHHMPLGLQLLTQRTFKKNMPTDAQLEAGIMVVEDAVMPLARLVPPHTVLATHDPLLLQIARQAAGLPPPTTQTSQAEPPCVTREAIEALFEQLVQQASRPYGGTDPDLPQDPRWAAALLILREALHHWQCSHLHLLPPPQPGTTIQP